MARHAISLQFPNSETLVETGYLRDSELFYLIRENGKVRTAKQFKEFAPNQEIALDAMVNTTMFPSECASHESTEKLAEEVRQFIHQYADLPRFWEQFITYYVLMTWVYERFDALPYLRILAPAGTGKTRVARICSVLTMRGSMISGSISAAGLFRLTDVVQGCLSIDEADKQKSDMYADLVKVLNQGYTRGMNVIRCQKETFKPESYRVYGPKVLTCRSLFDDESLESRCITMQAKVHAIRKDVPLHFPDAAYEQAQVLRNKLLSWRFENYFRTAVDESQLRNLLQPRLAQIGLPLLAVIDDAEFKKEFIEFLDASGRERVAASEEAITVSVLRGMVNGSHKPIRVKSIADALTMKGPEYGFSKDGFSPRKVGSILRSLDLHPERTRNGYEVVVTPQRVSALVEMFPMETEAVQ
jgi:hypothetical protein